MTQFKEARLFICKGHLFLAATPDMLVECSCCGAGVVEVKCPWKVKDGRLTDLLKDANSCVREVDGELKLKPTHRYYYQIQVQMFVRKKSYADFVLWNAQEINVQRIQKDDSFIASLILTASSYFRTVLLPELVAQWFSQTLERTCRTRLMTSSLIKNQALIQPQHWCRLCQIRVFLSRGLSWSKCLAVCTDGARAMTGRVIIIPMWQVNNNIVH